MTEIITPELRELFRKYMNEDLILAVAGNPAVKGDGIPSKLRIRPVTLKNGQQFQATKTVGTQEKHENGDVDSMIRILSSMIEEGPRFGQIELKNEENSATVLISRKGHITVKERRIAKSPAEAGNGGKTALQDGKRKDAGCGISVQKPDISGPDRRKNHILPEGVPVPFLVELGVMNRDGFVVKARYDKFRQINRYLEFVNDIVPELGYKRRIEIIDFGCGKSYLTFALYHFLHESKGMNVHITGLDLKKDVINECSRLAADLGYDDLEFRHGDIADYVTDRGVDMVVTLHACDTATDYALYNAIRWNARVIFCVPCCQHELNKQIQSRELAPLLKYGIIKERAAALFTDAMRACMLEEQGYKTQILEFIDMEHTPKNLLIRAVKKPEHRLMGPAAADTQPRIPEGEVRDYERLLEEFGSELTLHRLLRKQ